MQTCSLNGGQQKMTVSCSQVRPPTSSSTLLISGRQKRNSRCFGSCYFSYWSLKVPILFKQLFRFLRCMYRRIHRYAIMILASLITCFAQSLWRNCLLLRNSSNFPCAGSIVYASSSVLYHNVSLFMWLIVITRNYCKSLKVAKSSVGWCFFFCNNSSPDVVLSKGASSNPFLRGFLRRLVEERSAL